MVTLVRTFSSLLNGCGKSMHLYCWIPDFRGNAFNPFANDFYHAEEVSFQSKFVVCFYHKMCWILTNPFSASIKKIMWVLLFHSVNVTYYIE